MSYQEHIKPTVSVSLFGGEVRVDAFGCEHGQNFSFNGIDGSIDAHVTHAPIFAALSSIGATCDYFAPSPRLMNAEIVTPLQTVNGLVSKKWLSKTMVQPSKQFHLYRGISADGLSGLNAWNGYVVSSADCALIVVKCDDMTIAAHAGRDSIIDMSFLKGGPRRKHESVVENICTSVLGYEKLHRAKVWIGFSISAGPHFQYVKEDSRYPHNKKLVEYITRKYGKNCFKDDGQGRTLGWLDAKELIRQQFIHYGVSSKNIKLDSVCTYADTENGEYIWYSNVRNDAERNLMAVTVNK